MKINVDNFKKVLQKATLNFSIESVRLDISKEKIKSKMICRANDTISIMDIPNDVLPDITEDLQVNLSEPAQSTLPYLNLIEGDTIVKLAPEKMSLLTGNQTSSIFYCSPSVVSVYTSETPKASAPLYHSFQINDEFEAAFDKIKKIGSRFEKIYFGSSKGVFYIETTDRTNKFSNGLRISLGGVEQLDMSLCFLFKNVFNLMSIIDKDFTMNFYYIKEHDLGMLKAENKDGSEKYFLMSKKE